MNQGIIENSNIPIKPGMLGIILKEEPQFPLQYGTDILFPLVEESSPHIAEAFYWLDVFKATRMQFIPIKKTPSRAYTLLENDDGGKVLEATDSIAFFKEMFGLSVLAASGVFIVPMDRKKLLTFARIRQCFRKTPHPFLLSRTTFPYEGLVVLLNGPDPAQIMDIGIDIGRILSIRLKVLCFTVPPKKRTPKDVKRIDYCMQIVSEFDRLYPDRIDCTIIEKNSVKATLKYLSLLQNHLVIMATMSGSSSSFFKRNESYLIARAANLSTLVIPKAKNSE